MTSTPGRPERSHPFEAFMPPEAGVIPPARAGSSGPMPGREPHFLDDEIPTMPVPPPRHAAPRTPVTEPLPMSSWSARKDPAEDRWSLPEETAAEGGLAETVEQPVEEPQEGDMLVLGGIASHAEQVPGGSSGLCRECRGSYSPDGYCENCGAKALDPRHHFEIEVTPWLAGVCDRGIRHRGNEDALAVHGTSSAYGPRASLVVCDGVSTAPHSAEASLDAAEAAVQVLTDGWAYCAAEMPGGSVGELGRRVEEAGAAAAEAVARMSEPFLSEGQGGPSCTLVAASVEGETVVVGSVGDSRAYWIPDGNPAELLTIDDSWAAEQIRSGVPRAQAEAGPYAHTITRWLGEDSPDQVPALTPLQVGAPGWLLLCSDGLWNYASEPEELQAVVHREALRAAEAGRVIAGTAGSRGSDDPGTPTALALAHGLVAWANGCGGSDNITVALARLVPAPGQSEGSSWDGQHAELAPSPGVDDAGLAPTMVMPVTRPGRHSVEGRSLLSQSVTTTRTNTERG